MKYLVTISVILVFGFAKGFAQPLPALIPYRDGGKWGYCDSNGTVKIKPQWDEAEFFTGNKATVRITNTATCLIDDKGNYIIPPSRHWTGEWNGWTETRLNASDDQGRSGMIDTNNNLLIPFEYAPAPNFAPELSDKYKIVMQNGKVGVITNKNEVLIPFEYESITDYSFDTAIPIFKCIMNGYSGLVDAHNKTIAPTTYNEIYKGYHERNGNNYRKGFTLFKMVLVDPKDSSKGMQHLYGWQDFPGTFHVEPSYVGFYFISDRLYIAEGKMYDVQYRPVLPNYNGFYRVGDTIIAKDKGKHHKDSFICYQYAFDANTLQVLHKQRLAYPARPVMYQEHMSCGTGMQAAYEERAREEVRPAVVINGQPVKDYIVDSIHWYTQSYLPNGTIGVYGYPLGHGAQRVSVVNKEGHFLCPPVVSNGNIAYANLHDSLLIITSYYTQEQPYYSVCDLNGHNIVAPQTKIISRAFRGPKAEVFVAAHSVPVREGWHAMHEYDYGGNFHLPPSPVDHVCDTSLRPLPMLKHYYFRRLEDKHLSAAEIYTGVIKMADSAGRLGYADIDGHELVKKISFQYYLCYSHGENVFTAETKDGATGANLRTKLIDSNNRELLPHMYIQDVRLMKDEPRTNNRSSYPEMVEKSPLLKVYYKTAETGQTKTVYLNKNGVLYAGKL